MTLPSTSNDPIDHAPKPLKGTRLYLQLSLFLLIRTIMNSGFRMVYPFIPFIARSLGVTEADVTWGITARSALGLVSPFIGSVSDSWGRKRTMMVGLFIFIGSMFLVFLSPTYPALIASLMLTSLSKILFDTSVYAYVGDRVDYRQRGLAAGIVEFGWSGAFLLGIPLAGFLFANVGWYAPFPCFGLIAVGAFILLWRTLPNDNPAKTSVRPSIIKGFSIVRREPAALAILAVAFLTTASNETVNVVYGSWMENSFALKVAALGLASTVIGVSELLGEGLVAGLVDRLGKRRSLAIGLVLYSITCLLLPIFGSRLEGALIGLFLFFLAFEFTIVSSLPLMTEMVPTARATLMALGAAAHSLGRMTGSLVGPKLYDSGLGTNAIVASVLTIVAFILLWLFIKERPQVVVESA